MDNTKLKHYAVGEAIFGCMAKRQEYKSRGLTQRQVKRNIKWHITKRTSKPSNRIIGLADDDRFNCAYGSTWQAEL